MPKSFYITTPIYYVNDRPHIGHAYTTIACDVMARYKRLDGYAVKFLTGTDEHGQKIARVAQDKGITPQALADQNSQVFRDLAATLHITNDDFIRTTEPRHIAACQALWQRIEKNGHIYLSKYQGAYAVRDEAFYDLGEVRLNEVHVKSSDPIAGTASPKIIGMEPASPGFVTVTVAGTADQITISPKNPNAGTSPQIVGTIPSYEGALGGPATRILVSTGTGTLTSSLTLAPVEWVEEESYFFDLSKWQDKLLAFYDANPDFIGPKSRFNEVYSFVKGGLRDLSISRTTFSWGVPVPGNPKHVMYVWIDALTNYLSALGFPEGGSMGTFWPAADPVALHMIGKDIIRFHCVYWPAFLMAAKLPLPKRVFAHGWWTVEGQKMSKSLGNAIDPNALVTKYGLDQFRYFLLREVPFGNDGDFSEAAMANRINAELANALGNLAQRFLSFIAKNLGGVLPARGELSSEDTDILAQANSILPDYRMVLDRQSFDEALEAVWVVVRAANVYVDKQAPWTLRKTDPARMNTVLNVLAEVTRHIAILLQPFVPDGAAKILDQLGVQGDQRTFARLTEQFALKGGVTLPAPAGVFPRFGDPKTGGKGP